MNNKKRIVVSGINLFEGGPLSIYYDFLDSLIKSGIIEAYDVVAFVHKKTLFEQYFNTPIHFIELPKSRKSYFRRLYYEYFYFRKYSKKNKVDVWFSLHDITPNVIAKKIYTYCHNPSPFRKLTRLDFKTGIKNVLFPLFYKWVYRINIKKTSIIVQQEWMRKQFLEKYKLKKVIVCLPNYSFDKILKPQNDFHNKECKCFFYPAFPRSFKNYEVLCEAAKSLVKRGFDNFKILLTLNGQENKYSRLVYNKYKGIQNIIWLGRISRSDVFDYYNKTDCLVFPSFVETWGLPVSEFKQTGKGILLANAPYARETIGEYKNVSFFDPKSPSQLAYLMSEVINGSIIYQGNSEIEYEQPFMRDWQELIEYIIHENSYD